MPLTATANRLVEKSNWKMTVVKCPKPSILHEYYKKISQGCRNTLVQRFSHLLLHHACTLPRVLQFGGKNPYFFVRGLNVTTIHIIRREGGVAMKALEMKTSLYYTATDTLLKLYDCKSCISKYAQMCTHGMLK